MINSLFSSQFSTDVCNTAIIFLSECIKKVKIMARESLDKSDLFYIRR